MSEERIDTVKNYFEKVTRVNRWSNFLFWISIICSFSIFFSNNVPLVNYLLNIVFIITTVIYFLISNYLILFLLREAQAKRRINFLSNSLGVKLDDEETNLYYNNSHKPSVIRLGVNAFENTLFTWKVTEEMAKRERIKVLIYLLIWLIVVLVRNVDLNFIAIIAQTIFTTGIIVNYIKLELLRSTCKKLFNAFRQFFLSNSKNKNDKAVAIILNLVFQYETIIASMGIHLSSNIFDKKNSKTIEEWENVKKNVNL